MTGPPDCEEAVHRLRFIFGEYCLYNAWFEAVELTTHATRLTGSLDDTAERATLLLGHYGAVAIPAHPNASEPPWLTITRDYLRYVPASTEFYFIAPSTSYAEYWRRMPRKYRHELTRKVARFSERSHGEIDMRIYHSVAEARGVLLARLRSCAQNLSKQTPRRRPAANRLLRSGALGPRQMRPDARLSAVPTGNADRLRLLHGNGRLPAVPKHRLRSRFQRLVARHRADL